MKKIFAPIGWLVMGFFICLVLVVAKIKEGFNWVMGKILPKWNG